MRRQTDKQADRQTDRQTDRQADRQASRRTDRQADRQAGRQTGRRTDRQAGRQTGRRTDKQTGRRTDKQTGRRTDKQTGRRTDRQADRQTDRQTCCTMGSTGWVGALLLLCTLLSVQPPRGDSFNLAADEPALYRGPPGSLFGYALDFYMGDSESSVSLVIGAPKANTSQPNITEGGAVFYCPWSLDEARCHQIQFDGQGDRTVLINNTDHKAEVKSHQWFGATVRSHGDTILACAPLYSWRTKKDIPQADVTGTCYLSVQNFTKFVEYAPCRTEVTGVSGQGYCQGGFSADFTKDGKVVLGGPGSYFWQGQVISAQKEQIIRTYYPGYFLQSVPGQLETKQTAIKHDDNYQGYAVAVGDFSGDKLDDFVAGVPKASILYGVVSIFNGTNLKSMVEFKGEQMGSYFGYSVATTDVNSDGLLDLLVGAPMFMLRGSDGRLEEVGRVYVYLQRGPLDLELSLPHPTGADLYGRFGNTIAPLGDLNQDGFNDVAVSAPFGGEDRQGLVYIYNGFSGGLRPKPSQVIAGQWAAAGGVPSSFGFAMRGANDLDHNGYPDLVVGAFGVDTVLLYRSRPIVNTSASLTISPTMINPEEKNCVVTHDNTTTEASCVNLSYCISADGKHLPNTLDFQVEVQLDSHKPQLKGGVRRALFLDSHQASERLSVTMNRGERTCYDTKIYLRDEKEFRDKLSSIYVSLNFSLDADAPADAHGLRPILNYQAASLIEQKAQILLDCGEDNICVPDLKLAVHGDRKEVYMGDDNSLTLAFNARNEGEGGAYEAELYVVLPPEADYSGIARNNESLAQLTCSYEKENQTRYLSCDLGNPMKSGTSLWAGLRFTVPRLKDTHDTVQFDFQIRSKNENNSHSEVVPYKLEVAVLANVILQVVSRPDKVFFPPANWKSSGTPQAEQDVGPALEHVYELVNNGPSRISSTLLQLRCPLRIQGHQLLYPLEFSTEGPLNCTTDHTMNHLHLKLQQTSTEPPQALQADRHQVERRDVHRESLSQLTNLSCSNVECWTLQCNVGLLEKGTSAILKVRSRLWAQTFLERQYKPYVLECLARYSVMKMPYAILPKHKASEHKKLVTPVVWNKPDGKYSVPLWIIILAILAGLLLLALLIYVLYKLGFFKRSLPYGTAMEKAQLKPQASEA